MRPMPPRSPSDPTQPDGARGNAEGGSLHPRPLSQRLLRRRLQILSCLCQPDTSRCQRHRRIPTTFLQVLNVSTLDVTANAEAVRAQRKLEVALVLDVRARCRVDAPWSARRSPISRRRGKDLVDIVVWDNQTEKYYSKVALVPYAAGVNVGGYAAEVRGTIIAGPAAQCSGMPVLSAFTNASGLASVPTHISNCVSERTGAEAYTDAAPNVAFVGRNYPPAPTIPVPPNASSALSSDKDCPQGRDRRPAGFGLDGRPDRHRMGLVPAFAELRLSVAAGQPARAIR